MENVIIFIIYILVFIGVPIPQIYLSLRKKYIYGLIIPIIAFMLILITTNGLRYFVLLFDPQFFRPHLFKACIVLYYLVIYGCCRLAVYFKSKKQLPKE